MDQSAVASLALSNAALIRHSQHGSLSHIKFITCGEASWSKGGAFIFSSIEKFTIRGLRDRKIIGSIVVEVIEFNSEQGWKRRCDRP